MIDRAALEQRMDDCMESIASERDMEAVVLANLGQAVSAAGLTSARKYSDEVKKVSDCLEEIRKLEDSRNSLARGEQRRAEIQGEKKILNAEIRANGRKRTAVLEEIGRAALSEWKNGGLVHGGLEKALKEAADAELRLQDAVNSYSRNAVQRGDRTASIFARGRALILAARKKSAQVGMKRQWERAGMNVMEMIPSRNFAKTPVSASISSLRSLNNLLTAAQKRVAELKKELVVLDAALEQMPGKGGVRNRIGWIENALEDRHNDLDEAYRTLGRSWAESNNGKTASGDVEDRRLEWTALRFRIENREREMAVITEHLEYLDFQELAVKTRFRIEKLDEEISSRQAAMKKLKRELSLQDKDLSMRKDRLPELPDRES